MCLKKLGAVLLAVFALGAISASSAFATEEWSEGTSAWYTGASPGTKLAESKKAGENELGLKASAATALQLESTIGSPAVPFKLEASGLECVGCTIKNIAGPHAVGTFKWVFFGVKLIEPNPNVCRAVITIETKLVEATIGMVKRSFLPTIQFKPEEGETFATVTIEGATCPIAGTYKVTGTVWARPANATGVFAVNQPIELSKAIQQGAGTTTSLKFGANPAWLIGKANNELTSGAQWASKEK